MFGSFFYCPLFTESCIERELFAIDNEFSKNILYNYHNSTKSRGCRTSNPICTLSTGTYKSLKTIPESLNFNIRDLVMTFFKDFYSSNIMTLVIYGRESLNELQEFAEESFGMIVNKNYR